MPPKLTELSAVNGRLLMVLHGMTAILVGTILLILVVLSFSRFLFDSVRHLGTGAGRLAALVAEPKQQCREVAGA